MNDKGSSPGLNRNEPPCKASLKPCKKASVVLCLPEARVLTGDFLQERPYRSIVQYNGN
jgi:hypothetical protein